MTAKRQEPVGISLFYFYTLNSVHVHSSRFSFLWAPSQSAKNTYDNNQKLLSWYEHNTVWTTPAVDHCTRFYTLHLSLMPWWGMLSPPQGLKDCYRLNWCIDPTHRLKLILYVVNFVVYSEPREPSTAICYILDVTLRLTMSQRKVTEMTNHFSDLMLSELFQVMEVYVINAQWLSQKKKKKS